MNRIAVAAVVMGAALAGAGAAVASPQSAADRDFSFWKSPSGNIMCMYMAPTNLVEPGKSFVRCDVLQTTKGRTRSGQLTPWGRASFFEPTDVAGGSPQPVLRYGRTIAKGAFRCTSTKAGMTCRSVRSGHGFRLSRGSQTGF